MAETRTDQSRLDQLAEAFVQRFRGGEKPSIAEYVQQCPELAEQIQELFPTLAVMEQVDNDLRDAAQQSAAVAPAPPLKQLGDYRIIREVGRGGMGVVYEAEQISLGRRVALKVLSHQMLAEPKHRQRFEREARASARLHHTNIVPVFGVGEQDHLHYYVMQFIPGQGLDEVIVELRRLRQESQATGATTKPSGRAAMATVEQAADGISEINVAKSLLTGQFDRTLLLSDSNQSAVGEDESSGGMDEPSHCSADSQRSPVDSQSLAPDTAVGHLSDTQHGRGDFALPGQGESHSHIQSRKVYWQSVARIGVQAADALQYAHEQGIVHRDVKPANLLLDTRGTVWVTDFGLAKVTDQQDLTHTGDVLGTLRYMAPEQLDGKTDVRSDVFSLGLTLYELLSLQAAFNQSDRHKLVKQVTGGAPPRLRTLDAHIPRDLETIVHKAIDREPSHRYRTAGELAADLQRYLGDEPIRARWVSPVARFTRWCKRNPAIASLTTTIAILLVAAAVVSSVAAIRFQTLASQNADLVKEKSVLADDLQVALSDAQSNLTLALQQEQQAKANLEMATSQQQRAEGNVDLALTALDAVYLDAIGEEKLLGERSLKPRPGEAGFSPSARPPLTDLEKELLQRGLTFYDQFAKRNAATPRAAVQTAQAFYRVALLHSALEDHESSRVAYQEAIDRFERLTKEDRNNPAHAMRLGQAYLNLAYITQQRDRAIQAYNSSVQAISRAIKLNPRNAGAYFHRSKANSMLARWPASIADIEQAIALNPNDASYYSRAVNYRLNGDGVRDSQKALELAQRWVKLQPNSAPAHCALSYISSRQGDFSEALEHLNSAISIDPDHPRVYVHGAKIRLALGQLKAALSDADKAVKFESLGATRYRIRGNVRMALGNNDGALDDFNAAIELAPNETIAHQNRGEVYLRVGKYLRALEDFDRRIEARPEYWVARKRRAQALFHLRRFAESLSELRKARELNPKDLSTLVRIGSKNIATCPNEDFKQGVLDLADEAVAHPEDDNALARRYRAELLAAMRRPEAIDDYTWLIEHQPDKPAWRLHRGRLRRDAGDDAGAQADFDAYIKHFDEAIAKSQSDWQAWNRRGVALANVGRGEAALADFAKASELAPDEPLPRKNCKVVSIRNAQWRTAADALIKLAELKAAGWRDEYELALLSLSIEQPSVYRDTCRRMITAGAKTSDPIEANSIAWTVALAPDAVQEYEAPLALANKAVEAAADDHQYLCSLGAILHRAGRHEEALTQLTELAQQLDNPEADANNSPAYCWYFLAMTHHALGQADKARAVLNKANAWTDKVLADDEKPPAWNRKLSLELLRAEANGLISNAGITNGTRNGNQPDPSSTGESKIDP